MTAVTREASAAMRALRQPAAGWRVNLAGDAYVLDLGPITAAVYTCNGVWFWRVVAGRADGDGWLHRAAPASPKGVHGNAGDYGKEPGMLAAEDAADALLCAGLRALGRVP